MYVHDKNRLVASTNIKYSINLIAALQEQVYNLKVFHQQGEKTT